MFTIRLQTTEYRPDLLVTLRNNVDGWDKDITGIYENDEWRFDLAETRYPQGLQFKFVLETTYWMNGQNLQVVPTAMPTSFLIKSRFSFRWLKRWWSKTPTCNASFFRPI